jgi:chemotaxis protein histidine kinase CheA
LASAEARAKQLDEQYNAACESNRQLTADHATQSQQANARIGELEQQLREQQASATRLADEATRERLRAEQLEEELRKAHVRAEEQVRNCDQRLQRERQAADEGINALQQLLQEERESLQTSTAQVAALRTELDQQRTCMAEQQSELEASNQRCAKELSELRAQLTHLQQQQQQCETQRDQATQQLQTAEAQVLELSAANTALERQQVEQTEAHRIEIQQLQQAHDQAQELAQQQAHTIQTRLEQEQQHAVAQQSRILELQQEFEQLQVTHTEALHRLQSMSHWRIVASNLSTTDSKQFACISVVVVQDDLIVASAWQATSRELTESLFIAPELVTIEEEAIGTGSYGSVFKATYFGSQVAIKVLHSELASEFNNALVIQEFQMISRTRHPNVVQFFGAIKLRELECVKIVMELMVCSLSRLLTVTADLSKRLSICESLDLAVDIASGVAHLHGIRILHRDIKSENVLVDERMRAKVSDLGTAVLSERSRTACLVSPAYLAPERSANQQYDDKADVYSVGVTLLELFTYQAANQLQRDAQLAACSAAFESRGDVQRKVSAYLRNLLARCLSSDATQRPSSSELLVELTAVKSMPEYTACQPRRRIVQGGSQVLRLV